MRGAILSCETEVQGLPTLLVLIVKFGKGIVKRLKLFIYCGVRPWVPNERMKRFYLLVYCLLLTAPRVSAQKTVIQDVKVHRRRSTDNRVLVDKLGTLVFDDSLQRLAFGSDAGDNIDVGYDAVEKIVFDSTSRMRGGVLSALVTAAPFAGPVVGTAIAGAHVNDYWFYIEYKDHDHTQSALLVVPKNSSERVITKAKTIFGSRVIVADFQEKGTAVEIEDLKAGKSKQLVKVDKRNHPLPELKPDKATVVVVCPPLAARYAGKGNQFKLHANDEVVAVNKMGTYSFAYLDPGNYRLVSQTENANGFEMELSRRPRVFLLAEHIPGRLQGRDGVV